MKVKHKLEHFTKSVLRDALKKSDDILENLNKDYEINYKKAKEQASLAADKLISEAEQRLVQEANAELLMAKTKAKHELYKRQCLLTDSVFEDVYKMLDQYTDSPQYIQSLETAMEGLLKAYKGFTLSFILTPKDAKNLSAFSGIIEQSEEMSPGGFKALIKEKGVVIDNSYKSLLKKAREDRQIREADYL